jgi:hypothetical protein
LLIVAIFSRVRQRFGGLGNPRYSRLGNLRYGATALSHPCREVEQPFQVLIRS